MRNRRPPVCGWTIQETLAMGLPAALEAHQRGEYPMMVGTHDIAALFAFPRRHHWPVCPTVRVGGRTDECTCGLLSSRAAARAADVDWPRNLAVNLETALLRHQYESVDDRYCEALSLLEAVSKACDSDLSTPIPLDDIDQLLAAESSPRWKVVAEIFGERARQDLEWGGPEHDDEHVPGEWADLVQYQLDRTGDGGYRGRMVKIAALAVAAIESHDRNMAAIRRRREG